MADFKIVLIFVFAMWGSVNWYTRERSNNNLRHALAKADSLENVVSINDSLIMSLKSNVLIALKQVEKDSVIVENFKKNKPKILKGLSREEINTKFNSYFKSRSTKR